MAIAEGPLRLWRRGKLAIESAGAPSEPMPDARLRRRSTDQPARPLRVSSCLTAAEEAGAFQQFPISTCL
jgi:hypothetical protein